MTETEKLASLLQEVKKVKSKVRLYYSAL